MPSRSILSAKGHFGEPWRVDEERPQSTQAHLIAQPFLLVHGGQEKTVATIHGSLDGEQLEVAERVLRSINFLDGVPSSQLTPENAARVRRLLHRKPSRKRQEPTTVTTADHPTLL